MLPRRLKPLRLAFFLMTSGGAKKKILKLHFQQIVVEITQFLITSYMWLKSCLGYNTFQTNTSWSNMSTCVSITPQKETCQHKGFAIYDDSKNNHTLGGSHQQVRPQRAFPQRNHIISCAFRWIRSTWLGFNFSCQEKKISNTSISSSLFQRFTLFFLSCFRVTPTLAPPLSGQLLKWQSLFGSSFNWYLYISLGD